MINTGATLRDIASRCNVSLSAVSAVLRDDRRYVSFSEAVQRRVKLVARQLNYRPNRIARTLISNRSFVVAVVLHQHSFQSLNHYLADILTGVESPLRLNDMELLFVPYDSVEDQLRRLNRLIGERLVGGIIANFIQGHHQSLVNLLDHSGTPYVLLGNLPNGSCPCVTVDMSACDKRITRYARCHGFNRILQCRMKKRFGKSAPEYSGWLDAGREPGNLKPIRSIPKRALIITFSDAVTRQLISAHGIEASCVLTVEDPRNQPLSRPVLLVDSPNRCRAELAAQSLLGAIRENKPLPKCCTRIALEDGHVHLIT